jgi:hypothetical protein
MMPQEFAEKYADREVKFKFETRYKKAIGVIVGYNARNTFVYVKLYHTYQVALGGSEGWMFEPHEMHWTSKSKPMPFDGHELMIDSIEVCDEVATINTKDFPHTCNKCKSPAYISAFSIQCSKTGCEGK